MIIKLIDLTQTHFVSLAGNALAAASLSVADKLPDRICVPTVERIPFGAELLGVKITKSRCVGCRLDNHDCAKRLEQAFRTLLNEIAVNKIGKARLVSCAPEFENIATWSVRLCDERTGISFRLCRYDQDGQVRFEVAVSWGVA